MTALRDLHTDDKPREKQEVEKVESEIRDVLNKKLLDSYDRELFMLKNRKVFEHIQHLAEIKDEEYLVV